MLGTENTPTDKNHETRVLGDSGKCAKCKNAHIHGKVEFSDCNNITKQRNARVHGKVEFQDCNNIMKQRNARVRTFADNKLDTKNSLDTRIQSFLQPV